MLRSGDQAGAGAGRHVASCSQKEAVGLPCPAVVTGMQVQSQAPSQCPRTGLTGFSAQDRAASPLTHPSVCASAPALHWHSSPRTFGGLAAAVGSVSWPSRPLGSMWEAGGRGARLRGLQTSSGISCDLSLTLSLAAPFFPKQSPVSSHTSPANQRGILFLLYSSQTKTLF